MTRSYGLRHGTRTLFAKKFRRHGEPGIRPYLTSIKMGDYVDVVADPSIRDGMPHKFYHGKTGKVWNVTPRGVGVIINKRVRDRVLRKRICVRIEHVRPSRCQEAFKQRIKNPKATNTATESCSTGYILKPAKPAIRVTPQLYNFVQARKL
ncbi:60S ribosomal protein L21 [Perkinsela sp. CCAP 1560/4]|nr:60S ribosomal protein L21 [Perkinsela sp. CCAP 1560/4]|eukprot:KNH09260.1 60S ribosomal protein L21 [Perkinsela sp. CCAP 1560/4]